MPTSGEIVEIVAASCGWPDRSVATLFRVIREAGLIGTGGRGRSAMHLDLRDATTLLVACLASDEARHAHLSVSTTYALKPRRVARLPRGSDQGSFHHSLRAAFFDRLPTADLVRPASFGDVAERVMLAIYRNTLWASPEPNDYDPTISINPKSRVAPAPFATISVTCYVQAGVFSVTSAAINFGLRGVYRVDHDFSTSDREKRSLVAGRGCTMRQSRSVDLSALSRIALSFPNAPKMFDPEV